MAVAGADPNSHFAFRSYGSEVGLSNLSINAVAQTSDGLMWVGTEDGLFIFDGAHFHRLGMAEGLPSSWIFSLLADDRGVWVGTARGVRHVDRDHVEQPLVPALEAEPKINAITAAPDHSVWAATDLGLYTVRAGMLLPVEGWTGGATEAVWIDPDGSVIAGRGTELVAHASKGTWRVTALGPDRISQIARTRDGSLWVRSPRRLWRCSGAASSLACDDVSAQLSDVGEVGRLLVDRKGSLWVATRRGLAHHVGDGRWEMLGTAEGLPARSVVSAFEDHEGSLWIIADQLYQQLGHGLWRAYAAETGLPGDTVWAIRRDADGELLIGTNGGVGESHSGAWRTFPGTEESSIAAIAETTGDIVYAAGVEARVYALDRAKRTTTTIAQLASGPIVGLALDGADLWIATQRAGLWKLVGIGTANPVLRREDVIGGTPREDFYALVRDRRGGIWASGSDGLAVRRGQTWHRYTENDGLAARATSYMFVRASGEICVAYVEAPGVSCFRVADNGSLVNMRRFTHPSGLTTDTVYVLGEDPTGRLYVGTGTGVDIIDGAEVVHVSRADGLVGDDCAAGAFLADPDGTVMIGTTRGIARFDSARFHAASVPPAPVLMSVELDGARARASQLSIDGTHTGATSVAINFATPTFTNRERLEYQVRLRPLEDEWRVASVDEARYPQLAPGSYRFEVRSRRVPDQFGPTTAIELVIPPAWWQTWWLRALVVVVVAGAAAVVIAWRTRVSAARAKVRIVARSEASFRALIVQSPDCVLVHRDGNVVYANPRAVELLGFASEQELVGRPLRTLVDDFDPAAVAPTDGTLREIRMRGAAGAAPVLEVTSLQVDFDGVPAVLTRGRDVTARKALEARLMFTDRMASIGTLAAGIAHEINNPLAYVMTNIEVLREELGEAAAPALKEALGEAAEGALRIQNIVRGVKTFSRSDDDTSTPTDVHRALESALRLAATELRHRCVVIKQLGEVPYLLGNEARLGQVFINLLVNAAQAMPDRDLDANQIRLTTRTSPDGAAVIEIADNGHGMTPQVARRIFEPFFTTKDVGKGTGLGLAVCHGIVERFDGRIAVESTVGVGTTFRLTFPAAPAHLAPIRKRSATCAGESSQACLRLLLIDDDATLLKSIARSFSRHAVTACNSADDALALLRANESFDAILCDLMMPGLTGMELHHEVSQIRPELLDRMLFMTGGAFTGEAQAFLDDPKIEWIEKPFPSKDIQARVQELVADRKPRAA